MLNIAPAGCPFIQFISGYALFIPKKVYITINNNTRKNLLFLSPEKIINMNAKKQRLNQGKRKLLDTKKCVKYSTLFAILDSATHN